MFNTLTKYIYYNYYQAAGDPRGLFKMIFEMIGMTKENPVPEFEQKY